MNPVLRRQRPVTGRRPERLGRHPGWHLGWPGISIQLLLILLVLLVTGAAVVSYTGMVRHGAERQLQNTADLAEVFLNQKNAGTATLVGSVTEAADVTAALRAPDSAASKRIIHNILTILAAANPHASSVVITDPGGKVIADLPTIVPPGYDLSGRAWFQQARISEGFTVSPVFQSALTGKYRTTISVPVRLGGDPAGALLGVISVSQQLTGYQEFVDTYSKARGVHLSVLDGAGGVVVTDGGTNGLSADATIEQRLAAGRRMRAPTDHEITVVSAVPESARTGDWLVVGQESAATALRPAAIFRASAIATAALLLLVIVVFPLIRGRQARSRREAERYLQQSRSRMRDLADSSPNVVFQLHPDGTVIFISQACEKVLGRRIEELLGRDLIAVLEADAAPDSRTRLNRLMQESEPQVFTARTTGAGGIQRIVECSLRLGSTGDETEVWGALHDVTDRRTATDQVEQLFQLSADFMAVISFDGRLVQVNPVWTAAFDVAGSRLLGSDFVHWFEDRDRQRVADQLARMVTESAVATFENRYERTGITRTLLWTAAPDPVRRLIYAVGRDITEHKELARALVETRDEALEASRLKSEFVATMSHEIRTPMNGVIGLTDLLLGTSLDVTQRRYVEGVRSAGDALLSVINDILDFSKIEAGRLVLDSVDFRLEDVVDDVVNLVGQSSSAKGLDLTVDYESGVPFALNGDPGRVRQILLNIASNAVKFTENGGLSVRVEPGQARADGQIAVSFTVTDSGIGIDQDRLEQLFEPFRQADEGATRAYGGTGLGLSICRRLAVLMGGSITAASELGHGATFVAELVFAPAADWGRAVRGRDARGLAVLVVDDNEVNRLVMITQLSRWGMRPVAAGCAAEAMELLTERAAPVGGYDLAVIDMHLPGMEGMGLVRRLRAVPALAGLPVFLLSSDESVRPEIAAEYRISARLTKPVQQAALFDALTRVGVPSASAVGSAGAASVPAQVTTAEFGSGQPSPRDGGLSLLLVEDNDINQTVALGILSQLGYRVDVAGDGLQALTMAGQRPYDAILMDCQMPKMDGYTAAVELRKRSGTRSTPIIAMTAATFAADRQRCFDSGMDDFIAKPVRAATLQATLNRWLRADQAEDSISELPQPRSEPTTPTTPTTPRAAETASPTAEAASPPPPAPGPAPATAATPELAAIAERIAELLGDGSQFEVDLVREITASFLSRTVDLLQRLTLAVTAEDADAAYLHAHSLAGAGLNLGTLEVVRISRQVEADAKAGRPALSAARLVELEVALDRARLQLRDLVAALPDAEDGGGPAGHRPQLSSGWGPE